METRSRKRAEASSAAPSSSSSGPTTRSSKRARLSSSSSSSVSAPIRSVNTHSRASRSKEPLPPKNPPLMDPASESSGSGSRRDCCGKNSDRDNSDKGKEKEHNVRRDLERGLALNMEIGGVGDEDDNDSEGGVGILHQNMTSASSALQGLLRKLGAGLDDLLPSSTMGFASSSLRSGRMKKIQVGLWADGEEGRQIEALSQLCDILSIGTEDSLSTFSVDSFVPVLVGLLNHESNPNIMLLAARR